MEVPASTTTTESSSPPPEAYDAEKEETADDAKSSSTEDGASSNTRASEKESAIKKRSKKSTKRQEGNYNRNFLSNFKIENIFSFNKRHDYRLSQDEVGLVLSDSSAFQKLQSYLRQEGCVTDGTIRVNYNDLLRLRLQEIEEFHEESKEESNEPSHALMQPEPEPFIRVDEQEMAYVAEHVSAEVIDLTQWASEDDEIHVIDCVTPSKEDLSKKSGQSDGSVSLNSRHDESSSEADPDPAKKATVNNSPTSVLDMMDDEMKHIDQVFDSIEDEAMFSKRDISDEESIDDSSVDSGLFVENRTFDRPAASAPVVARPWGRDSESTKEEKIWDVRAVEAPATTMDFDHLWEDESNSEGDDEMYRFESYGYSSDEDKYDKEDSGSLKKELWSDPDPPSNDIRWELPSVSTEKVNITVIEEEPLSWSQHTKQSRVHFSKNSKKEFSYPSPGHQISGSPGSSQASEITLKVTNGKSAEIGTTPPPKKRISRRQKRHHIIETLEI